MTNKSKFRVSTEDHATTQIDDIRFFTAYAGAYATSRAAQEDPSLTEEPDIKEELAADARALAQHASVLQRTHLCVLVLNTGLTVVGSALQTSKMTVSVCEGEAYKDAVRKIQALQDYEQFIKDQQVK